MEQSKSLEENGIWEQYNVTRDRPEQGEEQELLQNGGSLHPIFKKTLRGVLRKLIVTFGV